MTLKSKKSKTKTAKFFIIVLLVSFIIVILTPIITYFVITFDVNLDKTALIREITPCAYEDSIHRPIDTNYMDTYATYNSLPGDLINAFVSTEDKRFFAHNGYDILRIASAAKTDLATLSPKEGGSTITQQLVKNVYLSSEKSIVRKIKELKLAIEIEKSYTKEEILELYVNKIYYGSGYYGITNAARGYLGKEPGELNLAECALLAGLVKNPRDYSPHNHPENAEVRMNTVLENMFDCGFITEYELDTASKYKYVAPGAEQLGKIEYYKSAFSSYFAEVINEGAEIFNISTEEFANKGYLVTTYIDSDLQEYIAKTANIDAYNVKNAEKAVIIADNFSGGISAYYTTTKVDYVKFKRSPASTIKPLLVYAPAIEYGYYSPSSYVLDEKTEIIGYSPSNFGNEYLGWCSLREAVESSSNIVAVKVMNEIGVDECKNFCENRFNIEFDKKDGLSTALGGMTNGTSFKELIEGYMTLADGGFYKQTKFIKEIRNADGKIIYEDKVAKKQTITKETAYILTDMLIGTSQRGTGKALASCGSSIACKTGTNGSSKGNLDAYNISYTANTTTLVWFGAPDGKNPMAGDIGGGGYPTMLAKTIYKYTKDGNCGFNKPFGIVERVIDTYALEQTHNLYLAYESTPNGYTKNEIFIRKYAPAKHYDYGSVKPWYYYFFYRDDE